MAPSSQSSKAKASTPPAIKAYLIAYNLTAMALWGYVLVRLFAHLAGEGKVDGAEWSIARIFGMQSDLDKLSKRSRTAYADFGDTVRWVQTFALMEVAHAGLGLVRSGLSTTIMQVSSRIFMTWYVCYVWPAVTASPWYCSMVFAWSVTEVIRYCHYAVGLLGLKIYALEWLRYSLFYVLYPLGAGSEAALLFKTAGPVRHHFGYPGFFTTVALLSVWPPSLLMMMQHMRKQRSKHLVFGGRPVPASSSADSITSQAKKSTAVAAKKIEEAVESATSSGTETGGKRVTRSRSKVNLKQ